MFYDVSSIIQTLSRRSKANDALNNWALDIWDKSGKRYIYIDNEDDYLVVNVTFNITYVISSE